MVPLRPHGVLTSSWIHANSAGGPSVGCATTAPAYVSKIFRVSCPAPSPHSTPDEAQRHTTAEKRKSRTTRNSQHHIATPHQEHTINSHMGRRDPSPRARRTPGGATHTQRPTGPRTQAASRRYAPVVAIPTVVSARSQNSKYVSNETNRGLTCKAAPRTVVMHACAYAAESMRPPSCASRWWSPYGSDASSGAPLGNEWCAKACRRASPQSGGAGGICVGGPRC